MIAYKVVGVVDDKLPNRKLISICAAGRLCKTYMEKGKVKLVRSGFCFMRRYQATQFAYNYIGAEVWECKVATARRQDAILDVWCSSNLPSAKAI